MILIGLFTLFLLLMLFCHSLRKFVGFLPLVFLLALWWNWPAAHAASPSPASDPCASAPYGMYPGSYSVYLKLANTMPEKLRERFASALCYAARSDGPARRTFEAQGISPAIFAGHSTYPYSSWELAESVLKAGRKTLPERTSAKAAKTGPAACSRPPYGATPADYKEYIDAMRGQPGAPSRHTIDFDFRDACLAKLGTPRQRRREARLLAHMETIGNNPMNAHAAASIIRTSTISELQAVYQLAKEPKGSPHIHYKPVTFRQFIVDGQSLAAKMAPVQISGVYVQVGQVGLLFRNTSDAAIFSYGPASMSVMFIPIERAGLSSHAAREALYDCREHGGRCAMTFRGLADMCTMTSNGNAQAPQPCLALKDASW